MAAGTAFSATSHRPRRDELLSATAWAAILARALATGSTRRDER